MDGKGPDGWRSTFIGVTMHLMLHKLSAVLGVQLLELMVACGVDPEAIKQKELDDADAGKQATDTSLAQEHAIKALMKFEDGLAGVNGTFQLVSCTGKVASTFQDNRITLSDDAVGCRVAISSLIVGDKVFHNSDSGPEWKTGDVLHFKAMDGSLESLDVRVDHQLSATPGLTEDVSFTVTRSDVAPTVGSKTLLAVGMEGFLAPNFRIRKTEFVGLNSDGAGQFVFHLDCLKVIKVVDGVSPACNGMALDDIHYQLIKDDYNSSLTYAQADAIFQLNAGLAVDETVDFEPFQSAIKQYGGFQTATGASVLEGPDRIHDNPHMLLILQGPGPSYQYFNVDVVFNSN